MAQNLGQIKAQYPNDPMRMGLIDKFLTDSESVVLKYLNFVDASDALAFNYTKRDYLGQVKTRSLNQSYGTNNSVKSQDRETLAIFGGDITTDAILVDAKGPAARRDEIEAKMMAAGKYFDKLFFHGDPAVSPLEFAGLRARSITKSRVTWAGTDGGALTQDLLDEVLDDVVGANSEKIIFCDRVTRRKISSLVKTAAGGKGNREAVEQLQEYNGARIQEVIEDEAYSPIFTATEMRGSSSVTKSLYVVRFGGSVDKTHLQGIKGPAFMTHRDVGLTGTQYLDVVDTVLGIGDFHPKCFKRLGGLTGVA